MNNEFSFKELYDVALTAPIPITLGQKTFAPGEPIIYFDKITLAALSEIKSTKSATGGYENQTLVTWEKSKEVDLSFTQGIFSKSQLSLILNSKMRSSDTPFLVRKREEKESDENKQIILSHIPVQNLYVYDKETGADVQYTLNENTLTLDKPFQSVLITYQYNYTSTHITLNIGERITNCYLCLEGKTREKDDITGQVKTGIITIPKLKLMSPLILRLGKQASPNNINFQAVGYPTGERGKLSSISITFLSDDIDSDIE